MGAHPEPITHTEIEAAVGLSQASTSRNMKRLGVRLRQDVNGTWVDAGMGLVETRPDAYETRKLASTLTKKGIKLMRDIEEVWK
jgi:DNA-binding MarR family transcriptional regulator